MHTLGLPFLRPLIIPYSHAYDVQSIVDYIREGVNYVGLPQSLLSRNRQFCADKCAAARSTAWKQCSYFEAQIAMLNYGTE
jgi:hypothetical protein